ncbi:MAG: hypothetical protein M1829_006865 [Trizodia sp. TS-e1964]|nr:MAG: hypothetical protein M1829_006865 [Trizodia sp. TS-e1964]
MPPSRRNRMSGPALRGAQSTISFGSRGKVTKASVTNSKKKRDSSSRLRDSIQPDDISAAEPADAVTPPPVSPAAEEPEVQAVALPPTPTKEQAQGISDAGIKKYWREKELERKTPRVHQQELSVSEKILRHFDVSYQYGPCIGIPRVKRWKRAESLGLNPPIEVLAVLLKEEAEGKRTEKAHIEELLISVGTEPK